MTLRVMGPHFSAVDDEQWTQWLERMRNPGSWMEGACLYAAANVYKRDLILITNLPAEGNDVLLIRAKPDALKKEPPLVIVYFAGLHFTLPQLGNFTEVS